MKENSSDPRPYFAYTRIIARATNQNRGTPRKSEHYRSNKNREIRVGAG